MYVYDCESMSVVDVNEAAAEKYGYTRGEFLQLSISDIRAGIPTEDIVQELRSGIRDSITPECGPNARKMVLCFLPKSRSSDP